MMKNPLVVQTNLSIIHSQDMKGWLQNLHLRLCKSEKQWSIHCASSVSNFIIFMGWLINKVSV